MRLYTVFSVRKRGDKKEKEKRKGSLSQSSRQNVLCYHRPSWLKSSIMAASPLRFLICRTGHCAVKTYYGFQAGYKRVSPFADGGEGRGYSTNSKRVKAIHGSEKNEKKNIYKIRWHSYTNWVLFFLFSLMAAAPLCFPPEIDFSTLYLLFTYIYLYNNFP